MSDLIKWSETNVGKYSMFDVELDGIKTTVSCDTENSEKLISLLNELEHTHSSINEENEKLRKEIQTSVLLSEAEKSTLALMRKQIDDLLEKEPVVEEEASIDHHYSFKPIWGYDFLNLIRACKILGFTRKEIEKHFHVDIYAFLKSHDLKFTELCGPIDKFYNQFFDVGIQSRIKCKGQMEYIRTQEKVIRQNKKNINDLAKDLNTSVQSLWAYHIIKSYDFTIIAIDGSVHSFVFDLEPKNIGAKNTHRYIEAKGGIKKLKSLRMAGYKQYEIAEKWGIAASSIANYITKKGEKWSKWPKE